MSKYYPIDEKSAKQSHDMMSFSDYSTGSTTASYVAMVNKAYELVERIKEARPEEYERALTIADRYARKLADNINQSSRIGCMCPSIMISGGSNFPVRKKERQVQAMDKNMKEYQEIQKYLEKINDILHGKEIIKSDDDMAIEKLKQKLVHLQDSQEKMKNVNAYYRKNKTVDGCPYLTEKEVSIVKDAMSKLYHLQDKPFPSYTLSNNNQNISSVKQRIERLEKEKERGTQEVQTDLFKVVENSEMMRLQIFFAEKPDEKTRELLKTYGFRWAPSQSAWQRQLTNNARFALKCIVNTLQKQAV